MVMTSWGVFKNGDTIPKGDKQVTFQSGGEGISDSPMVAFGDLGNGEYQFSLMGMVQPLPISRTKSKSYPHFPIIILQGFNWIQT
jgi:hypothetical protein